MATTTVSARRRASRSTHLWPVLAVGALVLATGLRANPEAERRRGGGGTAAPKGAAPHEAAPEGADDASAHGRAAETPAQIPARGWWDILKRLYADVDDDRLLAVAAGVTFYALLALFPAVAAFVSLYGLFADASTISSQLDSLQGILPSGALEIIGEQVKRIASKPSGSLSFALAISLAISLWTSNAGMKAMFDALNVVYQEKEKRSFVRLNAISLAFTVGALVLLLLALGAVVVVPIVLNVIGLSGIGTQLLTLARWPALLIGVVLGLSVLYRFGPSRAKAKWRWITWGSAFAAVGWVAASLLFSFYVSKFGSYNATYGSLGAAIGFMTWIWISTIVILIGAELSAEMEHQTARDTTTGPEKPMGSRGATMADRIAPAT